MKIIRTPNRINLKGPTQYYKTYAIKAPLSTHWRKATCAEVECEAFRIGWWTIVPSDSAAAQYIRTQSGRHFTEEQAVEFDQDAGTSIPLVGMTCFKFPPGQQAFASDKHNHMVPLERDPIFLVRGGDMRGNPTKERRIHKNADNWVDDFANHQDRIRKERKL